MVSFVFSRLLSLSFLVYLLRYLLGYCSELNNGLTEKIVSSKDMLDVRIDIYIYIVHAYNNSLF